MKRPKQFLAGINIRKADILIGITLAALPFVIPLFTLRTLDTSGSLVTAVTAVFAVVAGFFIADVTGNYLRLQTLIAEENACFISIAHDVRECVPEKFPEAQTAIDGYMIAQLDIDELDHIVRTSREFEALISTLGLLAAHAPPDHPFLSNIQTKKDELIELNQEITLAARQNLTWIHWFILFTLGGVVGLNMLALRDEGIMLKCIVGAVLLSIEAVIIVLRDMDNNRFLQRKLGFRNPQQVFRALLLPPYYPVTAQLRQRNAGPDGTYRTRDAKGAVAVVRA